MWVHQKSEKKFNDCNGWSHEVYLTHVWRAHCFLCEKIPHSLVMCGVFYINLFGSAQLWRCSSCLFFYHIISCYILVLDVNGVDICRQKPGGPLGCFSHILTIMCVCVCVCAHLRACISMLETFVNMNLMVQKRQSRPRNLKKNKDKEVLDDHHHQSIHHC
jgi:hypothetical protein